MSRSILWIAVLGVVGCASGGGYPVGRGPDVVIVGDDRRGGGDDDGYEDGDWRRGGGDNGRGKKNGKRDKAYKGNKGYRTLSVARGYYPPAGACRVWFAGRAVRNQPRVTSCDRLYGIVPAGTFVLYAGNAWDSDYDWYGHDRQYRGRVPRVIVQISQSLRR